MPTFRMSLRVVFYQDEDGDWIARCLEFDIIGDGATKGEAQASLEDAVRIQVAAAIEHDNPANLFQPADGKFFGMFAQGQDTGMGHLELEGPAVIIERFETREYMGDAMSV